MNNEWKKYFFQEMEKQAVMGAIMGALTVSGTMSDIKANKAKMRLAAPSSAMAAGPRDPYSHQFTRSLSSTPGRSLFG